MNLSYAIFLLDVIASLPILRTIRFLFPPRRERPDALFKKLISHGELQRRPEHSLSLSLSLAFFFHFPTSSAFFSYALNDCCFHGKSFRKLSRSFSSSFSRCFCSFGLDFSPSVQIFCFSVGPLARTSTFLARHFKPPVKYSVWLFGDLITVVNNQQR